MTTMGVDETCRCGAKFSARGDSLHVANRQKAFHEQHAGCRMVEPGMCGQPSAEMVLGEHRGRAICELRAGHAGFHEDGTGTSWGFPRWHTHASGGYA